MSTPGICKEDYDLDSKLCQYSGLFQHNYCNFTARLRHGNCGHGLAADGGMEQRALLTALELIIRVAVCCIAVVVRILERPDVSWVIEYGVDVVIRCCSSGEVELY